MIDFIKQNSTFFIVVFATFIFVFLAYFLYNLRYQKISPMIRNNDKLKNQEKEKKKILKVAEVSSSKNNEDIPLNDNFADTNLSHLPFTKEEVIPDNAKIEYDNNPEDDELEPEPKEEDLVIEDFSEEPAKKALGRYHIIYRPKDQQWIVKREGSPKVIRSLPTQKEAIAYATIKAITQDTTYVIHKKDGKIRKQNYSK